MALAHGSTTSMSDLQNMSPQQLLEMQNILLTQTSKEYDWFAPTENTETVSPHLLTAAAASPKPFVIGTNKDENKLWAAFDPNAANVTTTDWHQHVEKLFPKEKEHAVSVYENLRPGESPHFLMSAVNTDIAFRARAWSLVDDRVKRNTPSWMYWFTWSTPAFGGILGSCHALDIPFAFDNLDAPGGACSRAMLLNVTLSRHASLMRLPTLPPIVIPRGRNTTLTTVPPCRWTQM